MSGPATTVAPSRLTAQYEELRAQAVAGSAAVAAPLGLALFLRRGLAAWLAICTQLSPPVVRTVRPSEGAGQPARLPTGLQADAVRVLAGMALAACQKGGS